MSDHDSKAIDYDPKAIKEAINQKEAMDKKNNINEIKINNKLLAMRINNHLKKNDVSETITAAKLGALQNGAPARIFLHELLALAEKLDCFGVDFIDENVKKLGNFEVRLISFKNGLEYNQHILELEQGGRIGIFPFFPSYPYRPIATFNEQSILFQNTSETEKQRIQALINENIKINDQRLENLKPDKKNPKKAISSSTEYYTIDSFVKFLFSPFEIPLTIEQKIASLERMKSVFKNNMTSDCFFYTSTDYYQRQYAAMEILKTHNLVYLNLPIRSAILAIKNNSFCNQLDHFVTTINMGTCFKTTNDNKEAVELLEAGIIYLKTQKNLFCSFKDFNDFRENLKSDNLKELLKLAFPHL